MRWGTQNGNAKRVWLSRAAAGDRGYNSLLTVGTAHGQSHLPKSWGPCSWRSRQHREL